MKRNGQQFWQYQQNMYLSPQIINHKKNKTCVDVNAGPGLGQENKCDGIKSGNGIQNPS